MKSERLRLGIQITREAMKKTDYGMFELCLLRPALLPILGKIFEVCPD